MSFRSSVTLVRAAGALLVLAALIWLKAYPVAAQTGPRFPELTGRVVDQAQLLTPAKEAELSARLEALEQDTGAQLVVATIADLQGYAIEDYGHQLGRAWGVGQADRDNGVLLLVAPNERRVRIEVGYGLEPVLTDALSALIIHNRILPAFREGSYDQGIDQGVAALEQQLRLDPEEAQARAAAAARPKSDAPAVSVVLIGVIFLFLFVSLSRGGGRGRRRRANGLAPILIWGAAEAMRGSRGGSSWGGGFGGGFGGGGGSFGGGGASGGW